MTKCLGCGAPLQNTDPKVVGYTPKLEGGYCQRCFRLTHYDDVVMMVEQGVSDASVYEDVSKMDCLVCLVVDLFDLEGSLIPSLHRHIGDKDVLLIGTKRDLLPVTMSDNKLWRFVQSKLKEENIRVRGFCVCANKGRDGIDGVIEGIKMYSKGRPCVFMGAANVGKSSLINTLLRKESITTSRYPGTTIAMMKIDSEYGDIYDTPGVKRRDNIVHYLNSQDIKKVLPTKTVKPRNYQLYEPQSLALGGIVRVDLPEGKRTSVTCYCNDSIPIHRGKSEKAEELWNKHYGALLAPTLQDCTYPKDFMRHEFTLEKDKKMDVMIHGFGWIAFSSEEKQRIAVYVPKVVGITFGKSRI
ncbi:MAG: ribosome biogenesis GTPase YqeH [Erysipelotrichales bacterium]|nr:ribosome biogenesis GTPase YqeH [Erysipelotrichales bacterium]